MSESDSNPESNSDENEYPFEPSLGLLSYRNRPGRTGLDPIETYQEAAYIEGRFLKALFTGRLRTRNPIYLTTMVICGLLLLTPTMVTLVEILSRFRPSLLLYYAPLLDQIMCFVIPITCTLIPSLAFFTNVVLSLRKE